MQRYGNTLATSEAITIDFHSQMTLTGLSNIGLFGNVPSRPLVPGEEFKIALFAEAGSFSINGFQFRLTYDADVMDFIRFEQSANFVCVLFNFIVCSVAADC